MGVATGSLLPSTLLSRVRLLSFFTLLRGRPDLPLVACPNHEPEMSDRRGTMNDMAYRLTARPQACTKCGRPVEVREVWSDSIQRGSPEQGAGRRWSPPITL